MSRKRLFINQWVTMRCNFRCRYCYVKPHYANQDLSLETADALVEFVRRSVHPGQEIVINFHGGEPLLQFDTIRHIVSRIRSELPEHRADFGMTTNGSLLDAERIDFIAEHMRYNCSISIDGALQTMQQNRVCCDGTPDCYQTIEQNAIRLLSRNPHTRARMTFDRLNVPYLYENICYLMDLGFRIIVPVADYYTDTWTAADFEEVTRQFAQVRAEIDRRGLTDVRIDTIRCEFVQLGKCTAGHDYYSIDVFGKMYPCTVLIGEEAWQIGDLTHGVDPERLRAVDAINAGRVEECASCSAYDCCSAVRCRLINQATVGDWSKPNPVVCAMMNVKASLCSEVSASQSE